jgi:hypothetical protein
VVLFEGVLGWWCGKGLFKLGCVSCLRGNASGKGVSDGFVSFDEVSTSCACEGVMSIHVASCSALPPVASVCWQVALGRMIKVNVW